MGTIDAIDCRSNAIDTMSRPKPLRLAAIVATMIGQMSAWAAKRRSRSQLRDLTEDQLRDIGLTRSDVRREVAKSFFWD